MERNGERICFILNPAAGRDGAGKKREWLEKKAGELWENYEIRMTSGPDDLAETVREAAGRFDKIVACGGDGTVNRVANILSGSGCTLGVLPMGSGNDFAKALRLPGDPLKCLRIIREGTCGAVDTIRIRGDVEILCVNTTGIGLDGWANYYASNATGLRGRLVYVYGILKAVFNFRGSRMNIRTCNGEIDREILMVTLCNGPEEGGGFRVSPEADNSDGWMDVLLIDRMPVWRVLWYLPTFIFQPGKILKGVERHRCRSFALESEIPVAVHCDGEFMGREVRTVRAGILHGSLKVMRP